MGKKKRYSAEEMAKMEKKKNRKQFNAKLDDLGLQYIEEDIPPDEVDRDEVAKSWSYTLKSMIPYTKEYYEGMTAEMEMDDLFKIRVEQAKAKALLSKTRTGRHEEALEEMMDETNRDFHFFNKLKYQQTKEGKYQYKHGKGDPFRYIGRGQNRVRKAVVGQFSMLDEALLSKLSAQGRALNDGSNKLQEDKDKCCTWRGKGPTGQRFRCFNARGCYKFRFKTSRRGIDEPEYIANCNYHAISCLGDHDNLSTPKIATPNSDGLCNECYMHKNKSLPPKAEPYAVPGIRSLEDDASVDDDVSEDSSMALAVVRKNKVEDESAMEVELTEDSVCCWRPDAQESLTNMKGYICKNKVYRNPESRILYPTCAMHIKFCVKQHAPGTSNFVEIPNVYGFCNTHHMAEFACVPTPVEFPYPGMTFRLVAKGWMVKPGHWAAPTWRPLKDFVSKRNYREPEKPIGYINKLREAAKVMRYRRRMKQMGKLAAIVIQCVYRGYMVRASHKPALYQRQKGIRSAKIIIIQCQFRRFLHKKAARLKRETYTNGAIKIQKCIRGFFGRKFVRRHKAAIVLQNSSKVFKERRFFNIVMMMVNLRTVLKRRNEACVFIQKIARGYMVRARIYADKLLALDRFHRASLFITKLYGAYKKKKERERAKLRLLQRNKLLQRLAQMIEELYFQRKDYKELVIAMNRSAPVMQALVRGFIGLKNTKKLRYLRKAMVTWCDPMHAKVFLNDYLMKFIPSHVSAAKSVVSTLSSVQTHQSGGGKGRGPKRIFLGNHVPLRRGHRAEEVDYTTLVATLHKWYKQCEKPLLETEISSIYGRFRNPNTAKVNISDIDDFISYHEEPCNKHARTVCGDCVYFRECNFGMCDCKEFKKDKRTGLVCLHCSHPVSHHKLLPMALNPVKMRVNRSLLATLNTVLKPDLSIPTTIKGVDVDKVADEITRYHKRDKHRENNEDFACIKTSDNIEMKCSVETSQMSKSSLITALSTLEVLDITENEEYWGQSDPKMKLHLAALEAPPSHAKASDVSPLTELSQSEFWSIAAKNPNKTLRDYNEKFEHNMPMPLVQNGEIVYSLEGPSIYVQILERIVWLEEFGTVKGIHSDEGDFLRLVVDHIQIFERHWRKMVADMRTGTLNRHVKCSEEIRIAYTASAIPRPVLAVKLDKAFRKLGFHMKVIGKDIPMIQFAERKKPKILARRRPSFPENALGSTGFSKSDLLPDTSDDFKFKTIDMSVRYSSSELNVATLSPVRKLQRSSKLKDSNRVEALMKATSMGSDSVLELERRISEKQTRGATASRKVRVRRGSDTDISRPATGEEILKIRHDVLTEPRIDYHHLISIGGRFICPFPVCGKSYTSRNAAFEHLKTHEQKKRFYAPSPLSDSHMNVYWPEGNTWRDTAEYTKRVIPPGSIACTEPNCKEIFSNNNRLRYHLRWVHNIGVAVDDSLQNFYTFIGQNTPTPPNPPPPYAPLKYCSMHLSLDRKCPTCTLIASSGAPKQPIHFYDTLSLNFTKRFGSGGEVVLGRNEGKGVYFVGENDVSVFRGKIVAVIKDCKGDAWLAVQALLNMDEAQKAKKAIPRDAEIHHELMLGQVNAPPDWILLTSVKSTFYLLEIGRDEFSFRQRNNEVPQHSYFIRAKRNRKKES